MFIRFIIVALLLHSISAYTQISLHIHVDQFGYENNGTKVAVISDPIVGYNSGDSYNPGSTLEVRDFITDAVEYSGSPDIWDGGNTHNQSGDKGWWFDFSSVTATGTYYIYDPSNSVSSAPFEINGNPYGNVVDAATKMFYYNRCNATKDADHVDFGFADGMNFQNAQQDTECRYVYDQGNSSLEKDLSGGWFDAGDYNKYVTFAHSVIHDLCGAYEDSSVALSDDINIPESNDGTADILNEIKWELDWLMKMTNTDGTAHIKMGVISYNDNNNSPPSNNYDPRYYGPECTAASIAVASMFARAAIVFENESGFSSFASDLEDRAIDCWDHFESRFNSNNLDFACDDGTIKAGDADWDSEAQIEAAVIAAVYLYELTGDNNYNNFVVDNYASLEQISNGYWGPFKNTSNEALLRYTSLSDSNTVTRNAITNSATAALSNNWEDFYLFSTADLYRAEQPDYMYGWGSNRNKTNLANLCLLFREYNLVPSLNSDLEAKAIAHLHYMHGVNPLGLVMLTNMYGYGGDRCVDEVYHTWFANGTDWDNVKDDDYGPAPGFVTGGPNSNYTASLTPPAGQPLLKSYAQFNDGFPDNSWEITEPAIYYQSSYLRLVAAFSDGSSTTHTSHVSIANNCIEIFPSPSEDYFKVIGLLERYTINVMDANGNIYQSVQATGSEAVVSISDLPTGMFLIMIENSDHEAVCVQKIIKQN